MKLFLFPLTARDLDKFTEVFTVIPFLSEDNYSRVLRSANSWNEGLYSRLRFLIPPFKYTTSIKECDIAIIPFKYDKNDKRIVEYCSEAKRHGKKVVGFLNDDTSETFNLPDNFILYRTSTDRVTISNNERCLPVIVPDHMPCNIELTNNIKNNIITFCGFAGNGRYRVIDKIKNYYNECNFIIRNGFWAPELNSKQKARQEFYDNLLSGSFTLCIRGNGNFSYRFYEALCFGRIPVFIDTDCVLPFEGEIDWSKHIIKITENNIHKLPKLIQTCKISPQKNRNLWQTYFSPEGYYSNLLKDL